MKCFYHSADLDGHCSGAIVKMKYPECEMIGIDYGQEFPWGEIQKDEKVFMVDFSLQPFKPNMIKLFNLCTLVWIDHHKSSVNEFKEIQINEGLYIPGALCFDNSEAGCKLTWEYLMETPVPTFVELLSQYDIWNHTDPRTMAFQYGMRQQKDTSPLNQDFWNSLFNVEEVQRITEVGGHILEYQKSSNDKKASQLAFETELDGLKCIAMNTLTNSMGFESVWDPEKYDAMLSFCWKYGSWTISLFSDKQDIDVSVICKNRGGGGHKGAAGFQCNELPFNLGD